MVKLRFFLIALFGLLSIFAAGQNRTIGYVLDKLTLKPLEDATIEEIHQEYGCYTDSSGLYTLFFINESDSLKVSYLGYKNVYTSILDLKKNSILFLETDSIKLQEVKIGPDKFQPDVIELGFFTTRTNLWLDPSDAVKMHSIFITHPKNVGNILLKSVKFTYKTAPRNLPVRISIIVPKRNGEPGDELISESIIFNNYKYGGKQIAVVDLSGYNLFMPDEGVFIGLEWVMNSKVGAIEDGYKNGPYISALNLMYPSNLKLLNTYNQSRWNVLHTLVIPAIGLTLVNYTK